MAGKPTTFADLMRDFELSAKAVRRLARKCGIPVEPFGRYLTDTERDAMYDEWIQTGSTPRDEIILIDTCSLLMHPSAEIYFSQKAPKLIRDGKKIVIPLAVVDELRKLTSRRDDPVLSRNARSTLELIREYKEKGIIAVHGDDTDGTLADNAFQKVIAMFGQTHNITVITQDYQLGQDLLTMGHSLSVRGRKVNVRKFDDKGNLLWVEWEGKRW